jgi:hypothetical protein
MLTPTLEFVSQSGTPNSRFGSEHVRLQLFHRAQIKHSEALLARALKDVDFWGARLKSSQLTLEHLLKTHEPQVVHVRE